MFSRAKKPVPNLLQARENESNPWFDAGEAQVPTKVLRSLRITCRCRRCGEEVNLVNDETGFCPVCQEKYLLGGK